MYNKKLKLSLLISSLFLSSILLSGCFGGSGEEIEEIEKEPNTKVINPNEVDISKLPLDVIKLSEEEKGNLYNFSSVNKEKKLQSLENLSKDLSYNSWLESFQQEYESPDEIMEKLKYSVGNFTGSDRYVFKDNLNILILLDASGSMGKQINGESQMNIAKRALTDFVSSLPNEANIGLRVYGHKGKGIEEERTLSCSSSDLIYDMKTYNATEFKSSLNLINPSGWTPTDLALQKASEDLKGKSSDNNTNIIYLVSDGISTCDDDPVKTAKSLYESDLKPVINVIGFNVDTEAKKQLEEVSKVTNGIYTDVNDYGALKKEFEEVEKVAKEWKEWLSNIDKELQSNSKINLIEIYNYAARLQQSVIKYDNELTNGLDFSLENKLISQSDYDNLITTHKAYVKELTNKTSKLREDLRNTSDENLSNTLKEIEKIIYGN